MRRREFITLLSGGMAWPLAARAQQGTLARRIGVLVGGDVTDANAPYLVALRKSLQDLGWTDGRNVRFDYRFGAADRNILSKYAAELVASKPDVLFAGGSGSVAPLLEATRTVPIVFSGVVDPVALGLVTSLARPGGNATGFTNLDYSLAGKWLELLREVAPGLKRAAVLRDPTQVAGAGQLGALQAAATSVGVELSPTDVRDDKQIERAISALGSAPNGGLVVQSSFAAGIHGKSIVALSARYRVPAIYSRRQDVVDGGLMSYASDPIDQVRHAATYVDRILKGENPADLPVQNPTKYDLALNAKTAKALGLALPPTLLAIADEVIE
jgi:putative ABC transport system substrate-binding protein